MVARDRSEAASTRLAAEFLLPVFDYRKGGRRYGTSVAHDEAAAVPGHIELEVAGGAIL